LAHGVKRRLATLNRNQMSSVLIYPVVTTSRKGTIQMRVAFAVLCLAFSAASPANAAVCYTKSDGAPSAFDVIDVKAQGSIDLATWSAYYGQRYAALPSARKQKTTRERYIKYAAARFKGLDKDRSGIVTCTEYKASIERMKQRRLVKAEKTKPAAKPKSPVRN
jgi:hypothetical protein